MEARELVAGDPRDRFECAPLLARLSLAQCAWNFRESNPRRLPRVASQLERDAMPGTKACRGCQRHALVQARAPGVTITPWAEEEAAIRARSLPPDVVRDMQRESVIDLRPHPGERVREEPPRKITRRDWAEVARQKRQAADAALAKLRAAREQRTRAATPQPSGISRRLVQEFLQANPGSRSGAVADATGLGRTSVTSLLATLHQAGEVVREGLKGGFRYRLPGDEPAPPPEAPPLLRELVLDFLRDGRSARSPEIRVGVGAAKGSTDPVLLRLIREGKITRSGQRGAYLYTANE